MVYHCCYGTCNSNSKPGRPGYDPSVKFYRFPQPCLLLRDNVLNWNHQQENSHVKGCSKCSICWTWMVRCKRSDHKFQKVRQIYKDTMICSKHFSETPPVMDYTKYTPVSAASTSASHRRNERFQRLTTRRDTVTPTSSAHPSTVGFEDVEGTSTDAQNNPDHLNSEELVPSSHVVIEYENENLSNIIVSHPVESILKKPEMKNVCTQTELTATAVSDLFVKSKELGQKIETLQKKIEQVEKHKIELMSKCRQHQLVNKRLQEEAKQQKADKKIAPFVDFERRMRVDDKICTYYTGLDNKQLQALELFYDGDRYLGSSTQENMVLNCKPKRKRKLTQRQELLLMFLRLRGGLLIVDIAYRFNLTASFVSRVVTTLIQDLYIKFDNIRANMFPSRNDIRENLPPRFRNLTNVRVIIDCAEILCEKPSNFEQQGNTYSQSKAHTTYKVLIGCTPYGSVCFVSELFEGSISDRAIVEQSGLIDLLEEGDLVLADKGFNIKDLTDDKGVVLKVPAFLKGRDRLTPHEEIETKEIAANRIFVKHVVGRLKNYRIFRRVVPQSMRHILSQALFVCACFLNFREPFVK